MTLQIYTGRGWFNVASAASIRELEDTVLKLEIEFLRVKRINRNLRSLVSEQMCFYENERDAFEARMLVLEKSTDV